MPFLTVNDIALFHEELGAGDPVFVLVHGGMCDHRDWERLIPALTAKHRVVTLDLRAHGQSSADPAGFTVERCAADVNALIDALRVAPALLVGHSFGTRVVAEAAKSRPDNACGLVLIDGSRSIGGKAATAALAQSMPASLDEVLAATIGPYLVGAERQRLLETMGSASPALMAACVAQIERWDRTRADEVFGGMAASLPVLAIQSSYHDRFTPRRLLSAGDRTTPFLDFLREAVPSLRTAILPDTGHFSMIERPNEVAALLLDFRSHDELHKEGTSMTAVLSDAPTADHDAIAGAFRASVMIFQAMGTPLFAELSRHCAEDPEMLALAAHAPEGARPAALLCAVHYLLLGDPSDPLARYFATIDDAPLPPDGAYPALARFVRQHRDALAELLATRSVQTTYAERCRAILPPMCVVAKEAGAPLNLIEIGCSAGVLLAFDKFAYRMNGQGVVGSPDAPLRLEGDLRGGPELFIPDIARRIGIDLHTMDVRAPEERRWLLALCFPELRDEQRRLAKALDVVAATDITLLEGDGLSQLPRALAVAPDPLCVFHSACLFYWPPDARAALEDLLIETSRTRAFWRIGIEPSSAFDDWQKGADDQTPAPAAGKMSGAISIYRYRDGERERIQAAYPSPDYGTVDWPD